VEAKGLLAVVLDLGGIPACGLHGDRALRRIQSKIRKPSFDASAHPRDRKGLFVEVGGHVTIFGGGAGVVLGYSSTGRVSVKRDGDGKTVTLDAGYLTGDSKPRGGKPEAAAGASTGATPRPAPTGGTADPEASPVGASTYWEGPSGETAWMVGAPPIGYLRVDPADKGSSYRFDDLSAWLSETGKRGIADASFQKPPPTEDPADGAPATATSGDSATPDAPTPGSRPGEPLPLVEDMGDTFTPEALEAADPVAPGIDVTRAASASQVMADMKAGLPEWEGFAAWHMIDATTSTEVQADRIDASKQAKAEVVADLAARMADLPDADMVDAAFAAKAERLRSGEMVLLRKPALYSTGAIGDKAGRPIPDTWNYREVTAAQFDGVPPEQAAALGVERVDPQTWIGEERSEAVNRLVALWAVASNDASPRALVMQETAQEVFGLGDTAAWDVDFGGDVEAGMDVIRLQRKAAYREFLLSQYEATQERFAAAGITHVPLYRGHKVYGGATPEWAIGAVDGERGTADSVVLRPMSSFSLDRATATSFARGTSTDESYVITGTVPVARIIATPRTGIGSLEEAEVVVLGGGPATWQVERAGEADGPLVDDQYDPLIDGGFDDPDEDDEDDDEPLTDESIAATPAGALATRADMLAAIRLADTDQRKQALVRRAASMGLSDLIPTDFPPPE
jgi:hypothetical protein